MPIEKMKDGGLIITGEKGIRYARMATMMTGLRLEVRTKGKLKLSRGPSMAARIKKEFGLRG